jgi:hypothetical protein
VLGIESKYLDCGFSDVAISTSTDGSGGEMQPSFPANINCLSCPAQGNGETQREGRNYTITAAYINGQITVTPATAQASVQQWCGYWAVLVLDKQANGATISSRNVYDTGTLGLQTAGFLPQPLRNLQHSNRFAILKTQFIPSGAAYAANDAATTNNNCLMNCPIVSLSWKGRIKVHCDGTDASVASVTDNALHLLMYAGGGEGAPKFHGKSRVRFLG